MAVTVIACGGRTYRQESGAITLGGHPIRPADAEDLMRLLELAALCSEAKIERRAGEIAIEGSPTEAALIQSALAFGVDVEALRRSCPSVSVALRTEGRQMMSTVHRGAAGQAFIAVKGNPGDVLDRCSRWLENGVERELTAARREAVAAENGQMAEAALRVLGIAYRPTDGDSDLSEDGLVWVGHIGLADPTRPGMKELMNVFHRGGIRTIMITGDQSGTAHAIAREIDLGNGAPIEILDSSHLERLDPLVLSALAQRAHGFARVSPAHKLRIVQALQAAGKIVAMTGDGVNDSPALKAADIGVAMGTAGSDVAREVADVVLLDDDLRTMAESIKQGRTIYANIRKSINYLLSTGGSELIVTVAGTAVGIGALLSPMQLLWINLVSDVAPAIGLAMEPEEPGVLEQPPRDPVEPIVRRSDVPRLLREATAISAGSLAAGGYGFLRYGLSPQVGTITFGSLLTGQLLHAVSCRSDRSGIFNPGQRPRNRAFEALLGVSFALQAGAFLFPPLRGILNIAPIGPADMLASVAGGALPFVFNEGYKLVGSRRKRPQPA